MKKLATEAEVSRSATDCSLDWNHRRRERYQAQIPIVIFIYNRIHSFGENTKPQPQLPPLKESIKEALNDKILLALAVAALLTIFTGIAANGWKWGWIEGASIYVAIFIIVSISSINDWVKDKQFVRLQNEVKNEKIAVIRGKYGATQSVNIYDLVVGDIVLLETGCRVPSDCILVEGQDVVVDESFYEGHSANVRKHVATEENPGNHHDPFLISQSLLIQGSGKAVVCAVGANSRRGIKDEKLDTSSKTPLQNKLENLGNTFTKWGLYASLVILAANLINWIITVSVVGWSAVMFKNLIDMFTLTITIVIVAVPEGLPLSVSLSLAFSVMRMKDDGVLVKELTSPEKMGSVDEICTGKTGTLTKNEMKVAQFYSQSLLVNNARKNTILNCEVFPDVIELIKESILFNCEARIEMDDKAYYVPVGNGTEVGFIRFL